LAPGKKISLGREKDAWVWGSGKKKDLGQFWNMFFLLAFIMSRTQRVGESCADWSLGGRVAKQRVIWASAKMKVRATQKKRKQWSKVGHTSKEGRAIQRICYSRMAVAEEKGKIGRECDIAMEGEFGGVRFPPTRVRS